jgi:hypothetical protein
VVRPVEHVPVPNVQWVTSEDGQRNCPKHVEFCTKINLEISASVGFCCKEICYDGRSYERKIPVVTLCATRLEFKMSTISPQSALIFRTDLATDSEYFCMQQ